MMEQLAEARARRLDTLIELLEAAHDRSEMVDVDLVADLLHEANDTSGPEPAKPKPLTDRELQAFAGIDGAMKALCDIAEALAEENQPRRVATELRQLRVNIRRDFWLPRLALMTDEQRDEFMAETVRWGYTIVPPAIQVLMLDILERAARGAYIGKDMRAGAARLFRIYNASWPMGNRHAEEGKSDGAGADGRTEGAGAGGAGEAAGRVGESGR